jgi:hypothetical protein
MIRAATCLALGVVLVGCPQAESTPANGADGGTALSDASGPDLPYATEVVDFAPGEGAGYGKSKLPDVVLGPPSGRGPSKGSLDVLSLGMGGEIVLGFGERAIIDGPGPDFIVFENAFFAQGDTSMPYAEPGEVSVSKDGRHWLTFPCDDVGDGKGRFPGCAGVSPTLEFDAQAVVPLDVRETGGDAFDLADVGVSEAHFIRIRDLSAEAIAPSAGFDLDAIGLVHYQDKP